MISQELQDRVVYGSIFGVVALLALNSGGLMLAISLLFLWFFISAEFLLLLHPAREQNNFSSWCDGILYLCVCPIVVAFVDANYYVMFFWLMVLLVIITFLSIYNKHNIKLGLSHLYAGLLCFSILLLRGTDQGLMNVATYACLIAWVSDIGAYFVGKFFGGPKFAPQISPGKTISGAIGGITLGGLVGICFSLFANSNSFIIINSLFMAFIFAAFVATAGIGGDLFISFLKRRVKVKDTGDFLPGHGGLVDRTDSLMTIVLLLVVLYFFVG